MQHRRRGVEREDDEGGGEDSVVSVVVTFAYVAVFGQVLYPRDDEDWCMCAQKNKMKLKF